MLTPSDIATITTVNEGRASAGLPPMVGPDGLLTISAYKAKYAELVGAAAAAESGDVPPTEDPNAAPSP